MARELAVGTSRPGVRLYHVLMPRTSKAKELISLNQVIARITRRQSSRG